MFFHELTCSEIFDSVDAAGCTAIEFWLETPDFWLRGLPVDEICSYIAEHPSLKTTTVHAPVLDLNPCSINPEVAEISVGYACRSIEIAEKIGASVVTLHPGRRTARRPPGDADYDRFEYYMSEVRRTANGRSVSVAMENMEPKVNSLLCSPGATEELLDREPWLSLTLDIAHAMVVSVDEVCAYIDNCYDRIVNVHVSAPDSGRAAHMPVYGNPEIGHVLELLGEPGYSGHLILEIEDLNFSPELSREKKVGIISREIKYIKSFFS